MERCEFAMEVKKEREKENMRSSRRQLKAMLRKNWLLKIRHPFSTCAEVIGHLNLSLRSLFLHVWIHIGVLMYNIVGIEWLGLLNLGLFALIVLVSRIWN